jgi:hypothetical protein
MNRDDIIRMAREAGCIPRRHPEHWEDVQVFATPDVLERFAQLIEQHLSYESIHTCHAECQRPACVAVREAVALAVEPLQFRITDLYRQLDEAEKRLDEQYKMGIEAEREVCAEMVEGMDVQHPKHIAAAIRARDKQ